MPHRSKAAKIESPCCLVLAQPSLCLLRKDPSLPFDLGPGPEEGLDRSCRLARHLVKRGIPTRVLGRVGEDDAGHHLREQLHTAGVDVTWLESHARFGPTNLCVGGKARSHYPGAGATLDEEQVPREALTGVTSLHLDTTTLFDPTLRRVATGLRRQLLDRGGRLSVYLDMRGGLPWGRAEAQSYLRNLLGPSTLLILSEAEVGSFFPSFWTPAALLEGGHDLRAKEVLVLPRKGPLQGSGPDGSFDLPVRVDLPAQDGSPALPDDLARLSQILAAWIRGQSLREACLPDRESGG